MKRKGYPLMILNWLLSTDIKCLFSFSSKVFAGFFEWLNHIETASFSCLIIKLLDFDVFSL